jgi:predicted butyrate kinase (DUF1464 family)
MPRVIGIDPGTVTLDLCGIEDGRIFLDQVLPTQAALADSTAIVELLEAAHRDAPVDLIAGPSGYGLPIVRGRDLTENDIRLACLAAPGETGGIAGLAALMRALARSSMPSVFTPGVIHLPTVPAHRKVNRIDMGTADKVCAVLLAIGGECDRLACDVRDASFILLELGGAFIAAIAVERGCIVDGVGGSSGPIGARAAGAFDGEVAMLAGSVSKAQLFRGGAATIAGVADGVEALAAPDTPSGRLAWRAYVEGAVKAVASLMVAAPFARRVILSGRLARVARVRDELGERLKTVAADCSIGLLNGFAAASQAAQGAALFADGLSGGRAAALVDAMRLREASGTALDHLYVLDPAEARARLGVL